MKIRNFINNKTLVDDWLAKQGRSLEMAGIFFSHWPHGDEPGFGVCITDKKSGEFHLKSNSDVSSHVKSYNSQTHRFDVLYSDWRPTTHLHEFEDLFNLFKNKVIS